MQPNVSVTNGVLQLSIPILSITLNCTDAIEYDRNKHELKLFMNGISTATYGSVTSTAWNAISNAIKKSGGFNVCQWACFTDGCIKNTVAEHAGFKEVTVNFSSEKYSLNV